VDLQHSFGVSLQADYSGALVIKSLVPGGPADLTTQVVLPPTGHAKSPIVIMLVL